MNYRERGESIRRARGGAPTDLEDLRRRDAYERSLEAECDRLSGAVDPLPNPNIIQVNDQITVYMGLPSIDVKTELLYISNDE